MNERIKELKETAEKYAEGQYRFFNVPFSAIEEMAWEKFAELIIKDCVDIVNTWSDEKPCSEGYDIIPVHRIKEHFGVEE